MVTLSRMKRNCLRVWIYLILTISTWTILNSHEDKKTDSVRAETMDISSFFPDRMLADLISTVGGVVREKN